MKTIFKKSIVCILFLFGLNACRAEPIAENPDDNWPDGLGRTQERETDLNTKNQPVIQIWTFEGVKAMTPEEIGDLGIPENIGDPKTAPFFQDLEHWPLEELSHEQLKQLFQKITFFHERFPEEVYADFPEIKPEQLQKLTPEHIKKALCEIVKYLSKEQIKVLHPDQLIAMEYCMEFLTPEHVAVLDMDQIESIWPYLNRFQLAVVPLEYLKNDPSAAHHVVTPEQVAILTEEQIKSYGIPLFLFYQRQIHWLSCEQISWIRSVGVIKPVNLAGMGVEQLKCIPKEKFKNNLIDEQLRELSFAQLEVFRGDYTVNRILRFHKDHGPDFFKNLRDPADIANRFEYDIQFLKPSYFQDVTLEQARHFSSILLSVLTPERIKNFRHYVRMLKPMRLWKFSDEQLDVLHPDCDEETCEVIALTKRQIEAIPLEQLPDFSLDILMELGYKQVQAFRFEQIYHLSKEQLKALISVKVPNVPYGLHDVKLHAVIDEMEWSGGERGKIWMEKILKPAIKEIREPVCDRYHSVSGLYCESFEHKMKIRAEIKKECAEFKESKEKEWPAYLSEVEEYNINPCLEKIYTSTGETY